MGLPAEHFNPLPLDVVEECSFCSARPLGPDRQFVAVDLGGVGETDNLNVAAIVTVHTQLASRVYRARSPFGHGEQQHEVRFVVVCSECVEQVGRHMGIVPAGPLRSELAEERGKREKAERELEEARAELEQRRQAQPVIDLIAKQVAEQQPRAKRSPSKAPA